MCACVCACVLDLSYQLWKPIRKCIRVVLNLTYRVLCYLNHAYLSPSRRKWCKTHWRGRKPDILKGGNASKLRRKLKLWVFIFLFYFIKDIYIFNLNFNYCFQNFATVKTNAKCTYSVSPVKKKISGRFSEFSWIKSGQIWVSVTKETTICWLK